MPSDQLQVDVVVVYDGLCPIEKRNVGVLGLLKIFVLQLKAIAHSTFIVLVE
jgi:hypothetical protein